MMTTLSGYKHNLLPAACGDIVLEKNQKSCTCLAFKPQTALTLSLTGVGPFGLAFTYMQIPLKVQKISYCQKLGIP
jgi:hypothetical protein